MPASLPVILASASPRRQWLLKEIFSTFDVIPAAIDEEELTVEDPIETAFRLAEAKTNAVAERYADALVLGGDTVVAVPTSATRTIQFAKPLDRTDAIRMLTALGGRTHLVATGVGIRWPEGQVTFVEQTLVTFRPLSQEEILAYVDTGEPMDKAGGYGLQGIGGSFVSKFEGYESTVIGFPIERIRAELEKYGLV